MYRAEKQKVIINGIDVKSVVAITHKGLASNYGQ